LPAPVTIIYNFIKCVNTALVSHHINQGTKASTESSATVTVTGNKGKSAASFCHYVAPWVSDMFCNFYLVKNHKIANNPASTEAREKNKHIFGILRIFGWMSD
jgi:hypothetical protein